MYFMRATSLLAFGYYVLPSLNKGFIYIIYLFINHPLATPLMRRKPISPSLVYVLHKTWNLAFSCPGRAVMAKKIYKKAWCTCRVFALPIQFNLLPFWRFLCRRRCGILKSLMMIFLCCLCWLIINKPQPNL